jgi:hypothetical protein
MSRSPSSLRPLRLCGAFLLAALAGCLRPEVEPQPPPPPPPPPPPTREITVPVMRPGHAKYEPDGACFLGAYIHRDHVVQDSARELEGRVGKGHASYLHYVGYGRPFPTGWVQGLRSIGANPNIAFEPNDGIDQVKDDAYLRDWARAAAVSGGPVFLRFASEFNGEWVKYGMNYVTPKQYIEKYRLVARVMREEAPNVAMVWTPYVLPKEYIAPYYPGDAAVDWAGVNLYSVHHHNGRIDKPAAWEDPVRMLRWFYDRYGKRKPIQLSEYGATHYCQACDREMPEFAIKKMAPLYQALPRVYPRIKMIYYFSVDTADQRIAENNYGLFSAPEVLETYRRLISPPYFLSRITAPQFFTRRRVPLPAEGTEPSFPAGKLPPG